MSQAERRQLVCVPLTSRAPEIGRWLWALEDARSRTMEVLDGLPEAAVDWRPADDESTIGAVLYHLALIEADWFYCEVLAQDIPPEAAQLFPHVHRDGQGHLTHVAGYTLAQHLERLATVRGWLLETFVTMDGDDFRRPRQLEAYDVTPEWVLHHLLQHEAEHRSQLGALRARFEREQEPAHS